MVPTQQTDIVGAALKLYTSAFKNQPNLLAMTRANMAWAQPFVNACWQVINNRILPNLVAMVAANQPTADQIDIIGGLVGEKRLGRTDSAYLPAVIIRIRVNRSQGLAEDVIQVANLLFPGAAYTEFPTMKFLIEAWGLADPNGFKRLIFDTKATASGGRVHYSTWPPLDIYGHPHNFFPSSRYGGALVGTNLFASRYSTLPGAGLLVASVQVDPS